MKYRVLDIIDDGVIIGNKGTIKCVREGSIMDEKQEARLDVYEGKHISDKNLQGADVYWDYSRKQWNKLNEAFKVVNGPLT